MTPAWHDAIRNNSTIMIVNLLECKRPFFSFFGGFKCVVSFFFPPPICSKYTTTSFTRLFYKRRGSNLSRLSKLKSSPSNEIPRVKPSCISDMRRFKTPVFKFISWSVWDTTRPKSAIPKGSVLLSPNGSAPKMSFSFEVFSFFFSIFGCNVERNPTQSNAIAKFKLSDNYV